MVWMKFGQCPMTPWKSPAAWIYADFEARNVPCEYVNTGSKTDTRQSMEQYLWDFLRAKTRPDLGLIYIDDHLKSSFIKHTKTLHIKWKKYDCLRVDLEHFWPVS